MVNEEIELSTKKCRVTMPTDKAKGYLLSLEEAINEDHVNDNLYALIAIGTAIKALEEKEEREENLPLTLEQLGERIGRWVFVKNGEVITCLKISNIHNGVIVGNHGYITSCNSGYECKNVRFYDHKPKESSQ